MEMCVSIIRQDDHLHFKGENNTGNWISVDGGEESKGMRPMELLLTALGTCSAFDAALILKKQRQSVTDFKVDVRGVRPDKGASKPFDSIHLMFHLKGEVDPKKAERAISLAVNNYCSVGATFRPETKITFELRINQ
jgi:putative redox protein